MFNNTTAVSSCSANAVDSMLVKTIKYIVYSSIMVSALLGNAFIIAVVYKKKNMRKTTNMFIANMAASDMLIAVVIIPRCIVELYVGPRLWLIDGPLGSFTCKFCNFFADFSVCITITSHAVIAVDRFWAIVYSLRPSPITAARRKYIIASIWLYSFILHLPNLFVYKLSTKQGQTFCLVNWYPLDNFTSQRIFFSIILVLVICIPVILMTVLYTWLIVSLSSKGIQNSHNSHVQRQQRQKEDVTVLRKVVILLTVFLLSALPITISGILQFYVWKWKVPCSAWSFTFLSMTLLLSNSAVNPWLCIILHHSYRLYIRKMLLCSHVRYFFCVKKDSADIEEYELAMRSRQRNDTRLSMTTCRETINNACLLNTNNLDQLRNQEST